VLSSTAKPFFTIAPTRTTMLFPVATTNGGFNTGISVANTNLDSVGADKVFGVATANTTGGLKFYFFNGLDGSSFTLNTDATAGGVIPAGATGLNASGQLSSGSTFTSSLSAMLAAAGKPAGYAFSGYVMCVASFTNGHGVALLVSPDGKSFST